MSSLSSLNVGMFSSIVSKVRGPSKTAVTCVGSDTCFGGVTLKPFLFWKRNEKLVSGNIEC